MAVTNLTTEEWRTLPGSDGRYEVSTLGRIRALFHQNGSLRAEPLVMSAERERRGYFRVHIRYGGTVRHMLVHRLIATVFLGPPPTGRSVCNHLDGVKTNNAPSNLEWTTHKGNSEHAVATGLYPSGDRHGSHLHPESKPRGDAHWTHRQPERVKRGAVHPYALRPELHAKGERVNTAKLTEELVREIRARYAAGGVSHPSLGREYGVNHSAIGRIVRREVWKHLD